MKDLRITIVQSSLSWEDAPGNLKRFTKLLAPLKRNSTDIVVLPEMFTTGFSMEAKKLAEEEGGMSMQWMYEIATAVNAVVCGSMIIREKKNYYNRFVWMQPGGTYTSYDKRHLFSMGKEDKTYTAGQKNIVVEWKGWQICPQVCYDLRFPVWSRNRLQKRKNEYAFDYDLLLYVANWPAQRRFAWQQLLVARAIENQCFVAGVNRIGKDGRNIEHKGDSIVLNPLGEKVSKTTAGKTSVETVLLKSKILQEWRMKFPVLLDADNFDLRK